MGVDRRPSFNLVQTMVVITQGGGRESNSSAIARRRDARGLGSRYSGCNCAVVQRKPRPLVKGLAQAGKVSKRACCLLWRAMRRAFANARRGKRIKTGYVLSQKKRVCRGIVRAQAVKGGVFEKKQGVE